MGAKLMKTIIIAVILSATTAFAAATWVYTSHRPESPVGITANFDADLPEATRLAALEQAISQERIARQLLQEELIVITAELESLRAGVAPTPGSQHDENTQRRTAAIVETRRERFARRNSPEGRTERLVSAGIDPGTASWILQREEELQMESLQARFEAGRSGDRSDFYRQQFSKNDVLRDELGDPDYERYLVANGRPTRVGISSVIGSSPAQSAGLQSGDEIARYDGERVFSMTDINRATMTGEPGQNVIVDIVRDGVPMQVVIPRGPLGITGGRTRR